MNLLELFSTDRRLLETRGSLIIRQLCLNLNTEKIYRAFAEILEKEDVSGLTIQITVLHGMLFQDLEFASVIVQKLNIILITSPELADFRRRLKNLETRVCRLHEHMALILQIFISFSKMAKLYLQRYIVHGAIMLSPSSLYACSPKLMNMHQISCISCKCDGYDISKDCSLTPF